MVKIIVDSTSDIPQEEAARLGITVVPLTVRFGTEEYRDGVDLMPAEFFKKFAASKELPTTSQVSSGVFMDVFREQLAGKDDEIVALLFTHRLSGTYQSACIARNTFPRRKIFVVESGTGSFGIWLLVKEAVKMRDAGCSAGEIAARIDELKRRVIIHIALETLKFAQKGGRIPMTVAMVGSLLHVKPILRIQDGKIGARKPGCLRLHGEGDGRGVGPLLPAEPDLRPVPGSAGRLCEPPAHRNGNEGIRPP